ncbi:MAG TPA: hypothetical protein VFQ76_08360 [Longimicrobiaceae bacterium]|nr:hypothetical protein [Longimicrobiaceae bacterium]
MKQALSLLCVVFAAACALVTEPGTASLDREFGIREGDQVAVDEGLLAIRFLDVTDDSRCPIGMQCVWAGEGVVVLRLAQAGREPAELTLRTTPNKDSGTYEGYRVLLRELDPHPRMGGSPPETYRATLEVRRR